MLRCPKQAKLDGVELHPFQMRIPKEFFEQLSKEAAIEGISLNLFIIEKLQKYMKTKYSRRSK